MSPYLEMLYKVNMNMAKDSSQPMVFSIDPGAPDLNAVSRAAKAVDEGGVVIFPTTGLYGLGADSASSKAVDGVFKAKGRALEKPLLVLVSGPEQVDHLVKEIPDSARRIMESLWPGGITIIFRASPGVPSNLCGGSGRVGIRMAAHPAAIALIKSLGRPITGTSANMSGEPGASRICEISPQLINRTAVVLDAGKLAGGKGSTIFDATCYPPKILRQGSVSEAAVKRILA